MHTLTHFGNINCTWVRLMAMCSRPLNIVNIQVCSNGTLTGMSTFPAAFPTYPGLLLGLLCLEETLIANLDTTFITGYDFHHALSGKTDQLPILDPRFLWYKIIGLFSILPSRT